MCCLAGVAQALNRVSNLTFYSTLLRYATKFGVDVFVGTDELATQPAMSDGQESSTAFEMTGCRIYASSQLHECTNRIRMVPVEEMDWEG